MKGGTNSALLKLVTFLCWLPFFAVCAMIVLAVMKLEDPRLILSFWAFVSVATVITLGFPVFLFRASLRVFKGDSRGIFSMRRFAASLTLLTGLCWWLYYKLAPELCSDAPDAMACASEFNHAPFAVLVLIYMGAFVLYHRNIRLFTVTNP